MDPYIEGQQWEDFHTDFITGIRAALLPQLRPRYVARIEKRIYLEREPDDEVRPIRPDVAVIRTTLVPAGPPVGSAAPSPPFSIPLMMPEEHREAFLEVRLRETGELVTVIEVLSPTNKRRHSDGWREYHSKRDAVLRSPVHLVELDLLRGGERVPTARPLPPGDYYVLVSREQRRPMADVWPFTIQDSLPNIPIPLIEADGDVALDLQAVFTTVYDRAGYDYSLDYRHGTVPPLDEEEARWSEARLRDAGQLD
jgi:uncharacterized protein DUF4058